MEIQYLAYKKDSIIKELDKIDEICFEGCEKFYFRFLSNKVWIVKEENKIIGYGCARQLGKVWYLNRAGILPEFRGKGIQSDLIKVRLENKPHWLDFSATYVHPENYASLKNLQKNGFQKWDNPYYWIDFEDFLVLRTRD